MTTDLTPEKIAELEALDAARTRGEWYTHHYREYHQIAHRDELWEACGVRMP